MTGSSFIYKEISLHTGQNGHNQKNLQTSDAEEGVEKREPSYTVGGNVNWYRHSGEQYGGSLKKLNKEVSTDPAIPRLDIDTEKTIIEHTNLRRTELSP